KLSARTKTDKIQIGTKVHVLGHPSGLPLKLARQDSKSRVIVPSDPTATTFVALLDTFGGNSGSPVFRSGPETDPHFEVEGILIEGRADYVEVKKGFCKPAVYKITDNLKLGETCYDIALIKEEIENQIRISQETDQKTRESGNSGK